MKKTILFFLLAGITISLASCGGNSTPGSGGKKIYVASGDTLVFSKAGDVFYTIQPGKSNFHYDMNISPMFYQWEVLAPGVEK